MEKDYTKARNRGVVSPCGELDTCRQREAGEVRFVCANLSGFHLSTEKLLFGTEGAERRKNRPCLESHLRAGMYSDLFRHLGKDLAQHRLHGRPDC